MTLTEDLVAMEDDKKMYDSEPLISVILPVYNGGEYLQDSVQSVLMQDFKNFELLIIDDCSTDNSWDYLQSLNDSRVSLYRNEVNKGLFYNINLLTSCAKSNLVKLWSQDDIMYPDCLGSFVEFHNKHPDLGFSYSGRDIIDSKGQVISANITDNTPSVVSPALHARIAFYTGSIAGNIANVCINKRALDSVGLFNEDMKISADFDMWVRLARAHETGFIPTKLIQLRDHVGQLSRNEKFYINHVKEDLQVYRNLKSYVTPEIAHEGIKILRDHKLVFYYTLMVKAFIKGKPGAALAFYKELSAFDNFFILTCRFLKAKIAGVEKPAFIKAILD